MARLHLSPIVKEVVECLRSGDRERVLECLERASDAERRMVLMLFAALLMKSYGIDSIDAHITWAGPVGGVFMMCVGCPGDDRCTSFAEDIAEYVESLPGVAAALVLRRSDELCVETLTWDRVRRSIM